MKITNIIEETKSISSNIKNAYIDFSRMDILISINSKFCLKESVVFTSWRERNSCYYYLLQLSHTDFIGINSYICPSKWIQNIQVALVRWYG